MLPVSDRVLVPLATDVGAWVAPVVLVDALEVDSEVSVTKVALVLVDSAWVSDVMVVVVVADVSGAVLSVDPDVSSWVVTSTVLCVDEGADVWVTSVVLVPVEAAKVSAVSEVTTDSVVEDKVVPVISDVVGGDVSVVEAAA